MNERWDVEWWPADRVEAKVASWRSVGDDDPSYVDACAQCEDASAFPDRRQAVRYAKKVAPRSFNGIAHIVRMVSAHDDATFAPHDGWKWDADNDSREEITTD